MRGCEVCGVRAGQKCGGCGNISYCGVEHQTKDWTRHKPACKPTKVKNDVGLGDYLVAARRLKAGDLILHDEVGLLGPPSGETPGAPLCLGCYFPAPTFSCPGCQVPMCGPTCSDSTHHKQECEELKANDLGEKIQSDRSLYGLITPLRFLAMKKRDPAKFRKCFSLSTNQAQRAEQSDFNVYTDKARLYSSLVETADEETMLKILMIIDTNTFQVLSAGSGENLCGLYPRVAKINHSCVPNSRTVFCKDYSMKVIATVDIEAGESITISYTPPFYTTFSRQKILLRGKQFTCLCPRCQDPTELGTMLSGIRCSSCKAGWILRDRELNLAPGYSCSECCGKMSADEYTSVENTLLNIQTNINKESVEDLEEILFKYSDILHPNHALLTECRQHLGAAIGRVEGHRYDQIGRDKLELKQEISLKLLDVLSILEPGISKSRGITLLDLTETQARLAVLTCAEKGSELLQQFMRIEKRLEECYSILSYEDEQAIEGNVCKVAREQLQSLRLSIQDLRQGKK